MAETKLRQSDWFAPLTTLVTVVVAVGTLYYTAVQAELARKTFEVTVNEAHAGVQKELADFQRQLAAGSTDRNFADLLGRLADLQSKLAEQERRATIGGRESLAVVQQQMADLQAALARLKKEQDQKDQEIAALRAARTAPSTPPLTSPLLSGTGLLPSASLPNNFPLPGKLGVPGIWKLSPTKALQVPDDSFFSRIRACLLSVAAIFSKYPGPSVYFAIASLMALGKLFGKK